MMLRVRSHAKINWALQIVARRLDGYHNIETVFQTISLYDELIFRPADRLSLSCDDPTIPCDESNLVMRAARALGAPPVAIELRKRIPAGGGLGGGSSNAAATLIALDQMNRMATPTDRLKEIGLSIGSDVPFFLIGGTAYAAGRGDWLVPFPPPPQIHLLMLTPEVRVSTAEAYSYVDLYSQPVGVEHYRKLCTDIIGNAAELTNDFEDFIFERHPELRELARRVSEAGAGWARMSGSGSTIVGAFSNSGAADKAARAFSDVPWLRALTHHGPAVVVESAAETRYSRP